VITLKDERSITSQRTLPRQHRVLSAAGKCDVIRSHDATGNLSTDPILRIGGSWSHASAFSSANFHQRIKKWLHPQAVADNSESGNCGLACRIAARFLFFGKVWRCRTTLAHSQPFFRQSDPVLGSLGYVEPQMMIVTPESLSTMEGVALLLRPRVRAPDEAWVEPIQFCIFAVGRSIFGCE
jgi:hypothetical protein